jgi:hypothetical protein
MKRKGGRQENAELQVAGIHLQFGFMGRALYSGRTWKRLSTAASVLTAEVAAKVSPNNVVLQQQVGTQRSVQVFLVILCGDFRCQFRKPGSRRARCFSSAPPAGVIWHAQHALEEQRILASFVLECRFSELSLTSGPGML